VLADTRSKIYNLKLMSDIQEKESKEKSIIGGRHRVCKVLVLGETLASPRIQIRS
jgi:hypothetical protein